jgi:hypothetical protein
VRDLRSYDSPACSETFREDERTTGDDSEHGRKPIAHRRHRQSGRVLHGNQSGDQYRGGAEQT